MEAIRPKFRVGREGRERIHCGSVYETRVHIDAPIRLGAEVRVGVTKQFIEWMAKVGVVEGFRVRRRSKEKATVDISSVNRNVRS